MLARAIRNVLILSVPDDILSPLRLPVAFSLTIAASAMGADSVGSRACAACHAELYQSFMRTPMAQSSGRTGTAEPKEQFDQPEFRDSNNAFAYKARENANSYYFDFRQLRAGSPVTGTRKLDYYVGSGAAARSYLLDVDGFLYEAPVAFYRNSASWKAAPGFADNDFPYFTRPILPGCLQCHASGARLIAGTQNKYGTPPFSEGVACERCHGPGSEHIASGKPMVNPAKLAAAERDSICEQCHLSGEIRVAKPGKDGKDLQPGERLPSYLSVFVRSGAPSELKVTSHVENLAQSACKRASGDKLWCGTCHNPHFVPAPNEKAAYFRSKCLTCHETSACGGPQAAKRANGDDCLACHMPRNPTTDVEHVVFTDHSIRRRPSTRRTPPPSDAELVSFWAGESNPRDLALGYAMLALRDKKAADIERAFRILQEVVASGSADAEALTYLAQFYRDRKDDAHALPLYQEAWKRDNTQYSVAAALGAYQMQRGNVAEAIRYWKEALAISPAMVLVRLNLAGALIRTGRADEAKAILQKALEFNPTFQAAKDLLGQIGQ
jgi:hypothetical protein